MNKLAPSIEVPPARSPYMKEPRSHIRARLDAIADCRWRQERPKATSFVPILEAARCFRDQQRTSDGITSEERTLEWFWDRLAEALLDGEFDGCARLHVIDEHPIIRMRLTSAHMRQLTADQYSYKDVVAKRLARSWCALSVAIDWCTRHDLPIPRRWQTTEQAEPSGACRRGDSRPQASEAAIRQAMIRRVEKWPVDKPHPSQEDDLAFLKAALGKEVNREQYRSIRQSVAPAWNRRGRPTKAKSAGI